jgi:RNA polymerase sigma-70 factor (ECF subfamily)
MPLDAASRLVFVEGAYRKHGHSVLRRARNLLGNEADAAEALQEVFLSLLERPDQFEHRSSVLTFLYSTTTHLCLNRLRNARTRARILEEHAQRVPAAAEERPEPTAQLRQLLARLPDNLRAAAVYHYLDEMTQEEIAETMGCSRRHVGNLLQRLRELVQKQEALP